MNSETLPIKKLAILILAVTVLLELGYLLWLLSRPAPPPPQHHSTPDR